MYPGKRRHQKRVNRRIHWKRKRQTGGFFSRRDFAFAGKDTVSQAAKVASGVIMTATDYIDRIAKVLKMFIKHRLHYSETLESNI